MSIEAKAWVLDAGDQPIAIAIEELAAVLYRPRLFTLPWANPWCEQFVPWQGHVVPLLDIALRLKLPSARDEPSTEEGRFISVMAWRTGEESLLGGIRTQHPPEELTITDEMLHAFPEPQATWQRASHSCFKTDHQVIPVVDLSRLFHADQEVLSP